MPTHKNITCTISNAVTRKPLTEHGTTYEDNIASTYITVPPVRPPDDPTGRQPSPSAFTIRLTSHEFIGTGVAVFVFIDGIYQCNRNRRNLVPPEPGVSKKLSTVDFLVRQKEEWLPSGRWIGREWRFEELKFAPGEPMIHPIVSAPDLDHLGIIEVVVLRLGDTLPPPNPGHSRNPSVVPILTHYPPVYYPPIFFIGGYDGPDNSRSRERPPAIKEHKTKGDIGANRIMELDDDIHFEGLGDSCRGRKLRFDKEVTETETPTHKQKQLWDNCQVQAASARAKLSQDPGPQTALNTDGAMDNRQTPSRKPREAFSPRSDPRDYYLSDWQSKTTFRNIDSGSDGDNVDATEDHRRGRSPPRGRTLHRGNAKMNRRRDDRPSLLVRLKNLGPREELALNTRPTKGGPAHLRRGPTLDIVDQIVEKQAHTIESQRAVIERGDLRQTHRGLSSGWVEADSWGVDKFPKHPRIKLRKGTFNSQPGYQTDGGRSAKESDRNPSSRRPSNFEYIGPPYNYSYHLHHRYIDPWYDYSHPSDLRHMGPSYDYGRIRTGSPHRHPAPVTHEYDLDLYSRRPTHFGYADQSYDYSRMHTGSPHRRFTPAVPRYYRDDEPSYNLYPSNENTRRTSGRDYGLSSDHGNHGGYAPRDIHLPGQSYGDRDRSDAGNITRPENERDGYDNSSQFQYDEDWGYTRGHTNHPNTAGHNRCPSNTAQVWFDSFEREHTNRSDYGRPSRVPASRQYDESYDHENSRRPTNDNGFTPRGSSRQPSQLQFRPGISREDHTGDRGRIGNRSGRAYGDWSQYDIDGHENIAYKNRDRSLSRGRPRNANQNRDRGRPVVSQPSRNGGNPSSGFGSNRNRPGSAGRSRNPRGSSKVSRHSNNGGDWSADGGNDKYSIQNDNHSHNRQNSGNDVPKPKNGDSRSRTGKTLSNKQGSHYGGRPSSRNSLAGRGNDGWRNALDENGTTPNNGNDSWGDGNAANNIARGDWGGGDSSNNNAGGDWEKAHCDTNQNTDGYWGAGDVGNKSSNTQDWGGSGGVKDTAATWGTGGHNNTAGDSNIGHGNGNNGGGDWDTRNNNGGNWGSGNTNNGGDWGSDNDNNTSHGEDCWGSNANINNNEGDWNGNGKDARSIKDEGGKSSEYGKKKSAGPRSGKSKVGSEKNLGKGKKSRGIPKESRATSKHKKGQDSRGGEQNDSLSSGNVDNSSKSNARGKTGNSHSKSGPNAGDGDWGGDNNDSGSKSKNRNNDWGNGGDDQWGRGGDTQWGTGGVGTANNTNAGNIGWGNADNENQNGNNDNAAEKNEINEPSDWGNNDTTTKEANAGNEGWGELVVQADENSPADAWDVCNDLPAEDHSSPVEPFPDFVEKNTAPKNVSPVGPVSPTTHRHLRPIQPGIKRADDSVPNHPATPGRGGYIPLSWPSGAGAGSVSGYRRAPNSPFIGDEQPPYIVHRHTVRHRSLLSHQMQPGRPAYWTHAIYKPVYLDTMDKPYAVFTFKYRSKEVIERILQTHATADAEREKKRLMSMLKEQVVDEYLRAKSTVAFDSDTVLPSDSASQEAPGSCGPDEKVAFRNTGMDAPNVPEIVPPFLWYPPTQPALFAPLNIA